MGSTSTYSIVNPTRRAILPSDSMLHLISLDGLTRAARSLLSFLP